MADGFRLVPVEAEVPPVDGEVGGNGQFFAVARGYERAVVANAPAKAAARSAGCPLANLAKKGKFASSAGDSGMELFQAHLMRIMLTGWILTGLDPFPNVIMPILRQYGPCLSDRIR
jgi:hypothetical protein